MTITDKDGKPGLRIESATSVIMRDFFEKYFKTFAPVIRGDRVAGQATVAACIDGLAGATALIIAGGQGSRDEVVEATIRTLRQSIERDLQHMARQ